MRILKVKDENNYLFNGETYGKIVCLGIYDSPDNWNEVDLTVIDEFEASKDKELDDIN